MSYYKQNELKFSKAHKNTFNVLFHILCGMVYMSCFFKLFGKYEFYALMCYAVLLFISGANIGITILAALSILLTTYLCSTQLSKSHLLMIIVVAYIFPEFSHLATGEQTVLTTQNFSILSIVVNFFGLLPFSIYSLYSSNGTTVLNSL